MMLKLQQLDRKTIVNKGVMKTSFATTPIMVNSESIISLEPHSDSIIKEVNGKQAENLNFSSLTYRLGSSTKTIIVLGEYHKIARNLTGERTLLNG